MVLFFCRRSYKEGGSRLPGSRKFRRKLPKPNLLRSTSGSVKLTLKYVPSATCALNYEGRLAIHSSKLPYFPQPVTRSIARFQGCGRRHVKEKVDGKNTLLGLPARVNQARKLCLSPLLTLNLPGFRRSFLTYRTRRSIIIKLNKMI